MLLAHLFTLDFCLQLACGAKYTYNGSYYYKYLFIDVILRSNAWICRLEFIFVLLANFIIFPWCQRVFTNILMHGHNLAYFTPNQHIYTTLCSFKCLQALSVNQIVSVLSIFYLSKYRYSGLYIEYLRWLELL